MSQGRPRAAQRKKDKAPPKVVKERLSYLHRNPGASGPRWARDKDGNLLLNEKGRPYPDPKDDGSRDYTERYDLSDGSGATPPAEVVNEFAKENRNRFAALHAEEMRLREARQLGTQVRDMFIRATQQGLDLPDEAKEIQRILESGKQKLRSAA